MYHRSLQTSGVFAVNCIVDKDGLLVGMLFINPDDDIPNNISLINQENPDVRYNILLPDNLDSTNYNCVLKFYDEKSTLEN